MGPQVAAFERAIADAVGTADAVAVSTGTAALHLAVLALGIGPGDEVIVPAYTFPATANAVELCGARAVLVDVDPETFLVRPELVAEAVTPRTRAVLAVHLFGRPSPGRSSRPQCRRRSRSWRTPPARSARGYRGTPCGALGLMGCLSFHPRKIVTTGEGGAVTTDEAELAAAVRRLRHHGIAAGAPSTSRRRASTTAFPTSSARSGSRSSRGSSRSSRRASGSPAGTPSASPTSSGRRPRTRATGTAGRRTSSRSTAGTRRSRACARQGIEAQIGHVRGQPAVRVPRPGLVPRRGRGVRASAGAAVRDDDDRGRRRPGVLGPRALRLERGSVPGELADLHDEGQPRIADGPSTRQQPTVGNTRPVGWNPAARSPPGRAPRAAGGASSLRPVIRSRPGARATSRASRGSSRRPRPSPASRRRGGSRGESPRPPSWTRSRAFP